MYNKIHFGDTWNTAEKNNALQLEGPILIIGASGFIGAKLYFSLKNLRNDVYVTASQPNAAWRLLAHKSKPILLDVTDYHQVQQVLNRLRPKTIFNMSAYGAYERQSDAHRIYSVNVIGLLNLIKAAEAIGVTAFVQAGSSSEYGLNCTRPPEDGELRPNSDYAATKGAASLMVRHYGEVKNFPIVNLRLYSIYGPWEERNRLIPRLVEEGIKGLYPPLVNPEISRDFVYIDDCNSAFVCAALNIRHFPGASINIASGICTTLRDIADLTQKLFKIAEAPQFGTMSNRSWDLPQWVGNPAKAEKYLGWRARTSVLEGLELTAQWEKDAKEILRYSSQGVQPKKISAIITCYRDHEAIPVMHHRLTEMFKKTGYDYEIIFVNDCSPTSDEDVITKLCHLDPHVIGITHSRNFGSQSAFLSGLNICSGQAAVLMDGDLQDPPELIPQFIEQWEKGFEVVYGRRVKREATFFMQIAYKFFYRVFKKLAEVDIPLDAGDFSLMDSRVIEQILRFPEHDVFLRGLRAWVGFKQTGIPYVRPERMFGKTTNSLSKNIWWAKKAIFSFSSKPLSYIQAAGSMMFLASILLSIFYFVHYLLSPNASPPGVMTIILLVLLLGGVNLGAIGVLGDYVSKILEEAKSRPKYIRRRVIVGNTVIDDSDKIEQFIAKKIKERYSA